METGQTRVYRYGALPACDAIRRQMRLGHEYYNELVEAENARRQKAWGAEYPPPPPHPRESKTDPACKCAACKAHWKAIRDRVCEQPPLDLRPLRARAVKRGLYNGTYLLIEQAFSAAWKKTNPARRVSFRSWRKGAICGVQIQKDYRERGRTDTLYRIADAPDPRKGRRARNGRGRKTLQIRVGSDNKRKPIMSEPIRFEKHRMMSGEIVWIQVVLRYRADREIWSVNFVCKGVEARTDEATEGVVAVDVSWRKLPDGSWRLGWARDDQGQTHELKLPETWAERTHRADGIRKVRDKRLVELQAADPRFVAAKSCRGVKRIVGKLKAAGHDPGQEIIDWLKRDRHLWQYEVGCRRRSHARRRDALANWVRMLRRRYAVVVIKDSVHKEMKEGKNKEKLHRPARRQGHHAAPGETVEKLCAVFGRKTGVELVSAKDTTNTCPFCTHVNDHGPERVVVCESCGDERDRDEISTRNMLTAYANGNSWKPTARKTTARFAKRHRSDGDGPKASATV